jgi:SRSO17 transposase
MRERTPAAMPPCFDRWCRRFDDLFNHPAQKKGFRHYLGGLLGESERKNLSQMAADSVGVTYHRIHHFLTESVWDADRINERRLEVMNQCSQTRISKGFSLIVDDSGHRKSGNFTDGVGRQYIGEIGKTDNGIVVVTTHLYDGTKSLPLDLELYQHATSLPEGKKDPLFQKKPEIALSLIKRCLKRGYRPGIVLLDSGYGNNTSLLIELEKNNLKYLGGLAKNRKISFENEEKIHIEMRLDSLAESLAEEDFTKIELKLDKPRTVWVTTRKVFLSQLEGIRTVAIVMNAATFSQASDLDYFITNIDPSIATPQWIVTTYSQRNWVEVFYREAKGWLGLKEYQVRDKRSLHRHFILVFTAYTFILWHQLTGGLKRRWATKELVTFVDALEAFRTAMSYRFVRWLNNNIDVFTAHKASLGYVWG